MRLNIYLIRWNTHCLTKCFTPWYHNYLWLECNNSHGKIHARNATAKWCECDCLSVRCVLTRRLRHTRIIKSKADHWWDLLTEVTFVHICVCEFNFSGLWDTKLCSLPTNQTELHLYNVFIQRTLQFASHSHTDIPQIDIITRQWLQGLTAYLCPPLPYTY